MIDAKELRIGNWIDYFFSDKGYEPIRVLEISEGDEFSDCEPIVLTHKILDKLNIPGDTLTFIANAETRFNNDAKYLHQLQNLYYALTGEELDYKP